MTRSTANDSNITLRTADLLKIIEKRRDTLVAQIAKRKEDYEKAKVAYQPTLVKFLQGVLAKAEKGKPIHDSNGKVIGWPKEPKSIDKWETDMHQRDLDVYEHDIEVLKMHVDETIKCGYRSRWTRYL